MADFPEVSSLRITPRATPITNPLDLPEIQLRVVGFLERKDLAQCLLVSKAWYKLLLPLIWKRTIAISSELRITPYGLTPKNLKRHSEHIQILGIHDNIPGQFTATYPKLQALTLGPGNPPENKSFPGGDLTDLIELNPSLVFINISSLGHYLQAPFWNAVADLPHLETIKIRDAMINSEDDAKAFWLSCQNMEDLCLTYTSFIVRDDIITQLNLTKMRSLELDFVKDMDDMVQLNLIRQCLNLEELSWYIKIHDKAIEMFAKDLAQRLWPRLEGLSLAFDISDEDLGDVLDAAERITILDISRNHFGPISFQACRRHFQTVTTLSLWGCSSVTSEMIQEILCSCPHLKELKGETVFARDIVKGGPWACLSLRSLEVCIIFGRTEQELHPMIFERISQLVQLERIFLGGMVYWRRKEFQEALDMRLDSGLGALEKLKNMRFLSCNNTTQFMEEKEIRWIIASWKNLETVHGKLNQTDTINESLWELLIARGIKS